MPASNSTVATLCFLSACYGIGFGTMTIPNALFVNPYFLIASCAHIAMGGAFAFAGSGIRRNKKWASLLAATCAMITLLVGCIAIRESIAIPDTGGLIFWIVFTLYFLCLAVLAVRHSYRGEDAAGTSSRAVAVQPQKADTAAHQHRATRI